MVGLIDGQRCIEGGDAQKHQWLRVDARLARAEKRRASSKRIAPQTRYGTARAIFTGIQRQCSPLRCSSPSYVYRASFIAATLFVVGIAVPAQAEFATATIQAGTIAPRAEASRTSPGGLTQPLPTAEKEKKSKFKSTGGDDGHPGPETLLVDIHVNGEPLPGIVRVEHLADGRLALPATVWQAARLRLAGVSISMSDGQPAYVLDAVRGLTYHLDRSQMSLSITAPAKAFEGNSFALSGRSAVPPNLAPPGVYVNYNLLATNEGNGSGTDLGGLVEGVLFNRWGSVVTGGAVRREANSEVLIRTETYWRTDIPDRMESVVVGDTVSSDGVWSRPARYGGMRYARDFQLSPGFITASIPTLSGAATLPSTVDLLVNNQRRGTTSVGIGPFDLTNVPVVNGAGQVNLIVRDLRGVESVVSQNYYLSPRVLATGLFDFSLEAGALRQDYGNLSNSYGPEFVAGSYRFGYNSALTTGGRLELQSARQAAGVDVTGLLGTVAVAHLAAAWSRTIESDATGAGSGTHWLAGVERVTPISGGSLQWEHFDEGFREFATITNESRPRDRIQAGGGRQLGFGLSAGINYTRQTSWDGAPFSLIAVSLGLALPANTFVSAFASKELESNDGWSAGLNVLIPLERRRSVTATSNIASNGTLNNSVQVRQGAPQGPGWGWTLRASDLETQRFQGQAALNTNYGQAQADFNVGSERSAVRIGANGSLGWLEGLPFATRSIGQDAFAVVNVGDLKGVEVSRSNQVSATTDSHGRTLISGLIPYHENSLSINPDQLPFDIQLGGVTEKVVPYARSGIVVNFPVRRSHNALVILRQPDGTPVPIGAHVTVTPSGRKFIVGKRGEAYLTDLESSNQIDVHWQSGHCSLALDLNSATNNEARVGPLTCGASQQDVAVSATQQ